LAAARVGQQVFALNVLSNCGQRCVFCGLNPSAFGPDNAQPPARKYLDWHKTNVFAA
jgi:hypothetical protein